jgi:pimeloyl-ACP methyl ester carboxylesterase
VLDDRVSALVFLSTSAATIGADTTIGAVVGLSNMITRVSREGSRFHYGWRDTNLSALLVRAAFGRRPSGRAVDDVRRMMSELPPEVATAVGRSIATHDVRSELAHVTTPTAVVVGSADRLTSVRHAKVIAEEIRGAELHVLDGIGHQVMQEAPEELVDVIDDLLAVSAPD